MHLKARNPARRAELVWWFLSRRRPVCRNNAPICLVGFASPEEAPPSARPWDGDSHVCRKDVSLSESDTNRQRRSPAGRRYIQSLPLFLTSFVDLLLQLGETLLVIALNLLLTLLSMRFGLAGDEQY